jgi:hypothetical protein
MAMSNEPEADIQQLADEFNRYCSAFSWAPMDPHSRSEAAQLISTLGDLFQRVDPAERKLVAETLVYQAKNAMALYTWGKALEARRTGSRQALIQGLIPVVMAGGRSDTGTGGQLLSLLYNSAEKTGLDAEELFAYGAQFATNEESQRQIRDFPTLPPELRDIRRWGVREAETPDGVVYQQPHEWMIPRRRGLWQKLRGWFGPTRGRAST